MSLIQQLKEKPNHIKSRMALFTAASLTGIVALVWFSTVPARFQNMKTLPPSESNEQSASVENPFEEIIAGTKEGLDSLKMNTETLESAPYESDGSALSDLSTWSPQNDTTSLDGVTNEPEVIGAFTPPPTPGSVTEPVPKVTPPTLTQEVPEEMVESKTSVILIGTTTKKSE